MTQLIGDILVLSRFKAGKFTLSPVPTQLRRGCLETTWKMIVLHQQQRGAAGKLNLVLKVDDSLPWVANVDAVRTRVAQLRIRRRGMDRFQASRAD